MIPMRIEFGHVRTSCSCEDCTTNCRHMPGYLIPSDLEKLQIELKMEDLTKWAEKNLRASPGALVAKNGNQFRIPTLVPARRENGWCKFLSDDGLCRIHSVSPFGCAFFDAHMDMATANGISMHGLSAVYEDHLVSGRYSQIWNHLNNLDLKAEGPEESRRKMKGSHEQLIKASARNA